MANPVPPNSRFLAAASVPHFHLHSHSQIPGAGAAFGRSHSHRDHVDGGKPSPKRSISEPQHVRRKAQPQPHLARVPPVPVVEESAHKHSATEVGVTEFQRSIASGVGTVFMTVIMNPLDVVKVRLQAQLKLTTKGHRLRGKPRVRAPNNAISAIYRDLSNSTMEKKAQAAAKTRLTGTFDAFRMITKVEGVTRLWSGLMATMAMRIPANIVYFSVYDGLKHRFGFESQHSSDMRSILTTIVASGTARTMSILLVSPLDLIRTKLQSQYITYPELRRCLRAGFEAEGIFSLWRGVGPTILRDAPYAILYWTNYEMLKTQVMRFFQVSEPTVSMTFWAGVASGVFASIVTTPFDVVKTTKQVAIGQAFTGAQCPTRQNTWRIMQQIRAQSGIRGLFAGVGPRVAMSAPASAILITCYEFTLHMFRDYNAQRQGLT